MREAGDDVEIIGTFDTPETARSVAKALNNWFSFIMDGETEEIPDFFDEWGVSAEDYALDRDSDVDWDEAPIARARGNRVAIELQSSGTLDTIEELLEALGAFDVTVAGEEE